MYLRNVAYGWLLQGWVISVPLSGLCYYAINRFFPAPVVPAEFADAQEPTKWLGMGDIHGQSSTAYQTSLSKTDQHVSIQASSPERPLTERTAHLTMARLSQTMRRRKIPSPCILWLHRHCFRLSSRGILFPFSCNFTHTFWILFRHPLPLLLYHLSRNMPFSTTTSFTLHVHFITTILDMCEP